MRRPRILVVDDDRSLVRLIRTGLELEGCAVAEAASLSDAAAALDADIDGVVLDRQLPDGDGLDLIADIRARCPSAGIVLHTSRHVPEGMPSAAKGDVDAILEVLHLHDRPSGSGSAVEAALRAAAGVAPIWVELCRRDPTLPDDVEPPMAETVVATLTDAFVRPLPVGLLDLALAPVIEAFSAEADAPESALAMLGWLRDAWSQAGVEAATTRDHDGISYRMNLVIDRMMVAAAKTMTRRLSAEALTDPLTGLGNRRAFDRALARETARAVRHDRPLAVAVIDVDGLKRVNDTLGHAAGDSMLVDLAAALRQAVRVEDAAYRLGGDEFALILADAVVLDVHALEDRIRRHGAPPFSLGLASTPPDHVGSLVELADARLYEGRYERRERVP